MFIYSVVVYILLCNRYINICIIVLIMLYMYKTACECMHREFQYRLHIGLYTRQRYRPEVVYIF